MTVSELIAILKLAPEDAGVFVGDTRRTVSDEVAEVSFLYGGGGKLFGIKISKQG